MEFQLSLDETEKLKKWQREQDEKAAQCQGGHALNYGAISGAYTFKFTPTTIGTSIKVINVVTKEKLTLRELL